MILDYEYRFSEDLSAVGLLGYNQFSAGSSAVSDTHWWNISANLKYHLTPNAWRPFVNGGVGMYVPESGSTKPGLNLGAGVKYTLRSDLFLEIGADYHFVFSSPDEIEFLVPHVGLAYRF